MRIACSAAHSILSSKFRWRHYRTNQIFRRIQIIVVFYIFDPWARFRIPAYSDSNVNNFCQFRKPRISPAHREQHHYVIWSLPCGNVVHINLSRYRQENKSRRPKTKSQSWCLAWYQLQSMLRFSIAAQCDCAEDLRRIYQSWGCPLYSSFHFINFSGVTPNARASFEMVM